MQFLFCRSPGTRDVFTNLYVGSSKEKNRHKVSVVGPTVVGQVGTEPQVDAKEDYRVRLGLPSVMPDYSQGKALLDEAVKGRSTRYQEELKRLEEEAAVKAIAEANAKAEAEAKAKIEALQKAEAEARAAAEKAATELKAKQEAEAAALAAAAKKKVTITCVKGKLTKKVRAIKPKCSKGYRLRA